MSEDPREITATDHINSKLLSHFKAHIDAGKVPLHGNADTEPLDGDWDPEVDHTNSKPGSNNNEPAQILTSDE